MELISPMGLAAMAGGAMLLYGALTTKRSRVSTDAWGSSHFATPQEIKQAGLFKRHGAILGYYRGRPLYAGKDRHVLLVAPSRRGKTELMLKTLQRTRQSVIAVDIKSTLRERCQRWRQRLGGPSYTFNPVAGGDHLNPWDFIAWGTGKEVAGIQRMIGHLTHVEADTKSDSGLYYRDVAQPALWAFVAYLRYSGVAAACFGGLRQFLAKSGQAIQEALTDMAACGHATVYEWAREMLGKSAPQRDVIWSAARRWLHPWADPVLAWNTHNTTIDLEAFQQRKTPATLWLNIAMEDITDRLQSTTHMLVDSLSLRLCDRREKAFRTEVLWAIDDMGELRYLPLYKRLTTILGGFGHFLFGAAQSFSQLTTMLGQDSSVLNNTLAWSLFAPMHPKEGDFIRQKLGEMTVAERDERVSVMRGRRTTSIGVRTHKRDLMTSGEVMGLPPAQMLVCVHGVPPIVAERGPLAA